MIASNTEQLAKIAYGDDFTLALLPLARNLKYNS
jgi:hypothetical protein